MCLDEDVFARQLAGRGKMLIARAGMTWRRAQSMLPAMSFHSLQGKIKAHHNSRALGFPRATQSLGRRDSGFFL